MCIEEVHRAIERLKETDISLHVSGLCRTSAEKIAKTARAADKKPPKVGVSFLAWPKASAGETVHYAVELVSPEGDEVVNLCPAGNLFPEYLGDKKTAPGYLRQMEPAEKVL